MDRPRVVAAGPVRVAAPGGPGFLDGLPEHLASALVDAARPVEHPARAERAWDGGQMAVVAFGWLRVYLCDPQGRQTTVRYVRAGDLVGGVTVSVLGTFSGLQAIDRSKLLHFDREHLERMACAEPRLALALIAQTRLWACAAYEALALSAFGTVKARVARDLVQRAIRAGAARPGGRIRVTHQALAEATGSVREVVARAIRDLRLEGAVSTTNSHVIIVDLERIRREAGLAS